MIKTATFTGGVIGKIVRGCKVRLPITVTISGVVNELTLEDAKKLLLGLEQAITKVEVSEKAAEGDGNGHSVVIGRNNEGMSYFLSKLPA